jgi:glycerol-3-phosphate acyltransferase PlsY
MSPPVYPPPTTLHGRWLFLARMAWVVVAITALAIVVFSVPSSFEHYSSVCTAASEVCAERAVDQATPEGVRALGDIGLSLHSYALLNVMVDKVFQLVWFVVGALIFWRRSDDWMALLVSVFLVSFGPVSVDPTAANTLISSQLS